MVNHGGPCLSKLPTGFEVQHHRRATFCLREAGQEDALEQGRGGFDSSQVSFEQFTCLVSVASPRPVRKQNHYACKVAEASGAS